MPYKPTGQPNGRPRKTAPVVAPAPVQEPAKELTRAHKAFRRDTGSPADAVFRPPRYKRQPGQRRPMLHPHVVMKA